MNLHCLLRSRGVTNASLLAMLLFASGTVLAGEKIIFSSRSDGRAAVDLNRKDPLAGTGLRTPKLGADPMDAALSIVPAAPTAASSPMTKKQKEELEQRRNWIFQDQDKAAEKKLNAINEREKDTDPDAKPKSSIERYYEGSDRKATADNQSGSESRDFTGRAKRDGTGRETGRRDFARDGKQNNGDGGNDFLGDSAARDAARQPRESGPGFNSQTDLRGFEFAKRVPLDSAKERARDAEREADMAAFQRILNPAAAAPQQGGAFTLIGPGTVVFLPGSAQRNFSNPGDFGQSTGLKAGGLDGARLGGENMFDTKLNSGTLLSPAPLTELEKKMEPRPIVLEIPKRKF
ncbi:MAG: hypothetical protein HY300_08365 [Verrucomicrobia bacterium]|nr:hypothetical protein [Verrucomicrobiota bacterium]